MSRFDPLAGLLRSAEDVLPLVPRRDRANLAQIHELLAQRLVGGNPFEHGGYVRHGKRSPLFTMGIEDEIDVPPWYTETTSDILAHSHPTELKSGPSPLSIEDINYAAKYLRGITSVDLDGGIGHAFSDNRTRGLMAELGSTPYKMGKQAERAALTVVDNFGDPSADYNMGPILNNQAFGAAMKDMGLLKDFGYGGNPAYFEGHRGNILPMYDKYRAELEQLLGTQHGR